MAPFWVATIPIGFLNLYYPRFLAVYLTIKKGVTLDNVNPRDQVEGPEVLQKDPSGYVIGSVGEDFLLSCKSVSRVCVVSMVVGLKSMGNVVRVSGSW